MDKLGRKALLLWSGMALSMALQLKWLLFLDWAVELYKVIPVCWWHVAICLHTVGAVPVLGLILANIFRGQIRLKPCHFVCQVTGYCFLLFLSSLLLSSMPGS